MPDTYDARPKLLQDWGGYVMTAAAQGHVTGKPVNITYAEGIAGPRAGVLLLHCGLDSERFLAAMRRVEGATLRQFIPWQFVGEPQASMFGPYVRLEAGWPDELAEKMVPLAGLSRHPYGGGRWVVGKNERGKTVIATLSESGTPHFLLAGGTGSGKTVALRGAVAQLGRDPNNQIVLLDGKQGEGLGKLAPWAIGPVATNAATMRAALGWAAAEMTRRYRAGEHTGRVIVVFDEFQEFVNDAVLMDLLRYIAGQGRGAGVHLLAATQHPSLKAFGHDATRRNLTGRLALRVADYKASEAAVGKSTPRADLLLGRGDCCVITPGAEQRVQVAFLGLDELGTQPPARSPQIRAWPEYDPESIGRDLPSGAPPPGRPAKPPSGRELAAALVCAVRGEGRPALIKRLERAGLTAPGTERLRDLQTLARTTLSGLDAERARILTEEE